MRLDFKLLVIDDNPTSVESAVGELADHLEARGFHLRRHNAPDLSAAGLKKLARQEGRDYDLVIIDYNLGRSDTNGAIAAARMRSQLPYTDIIFYSTDPNADLYEELAREKVMSIFLTYRLALGETLTGVADTIIGKAVDLSHMRGIAMAEVAEMDVMMEEILERVFSANDPLFVQAATATMAKLLETARARLEAVEASVGDNRLLEILGDGELFSSANKYMTVRRVAKCLGTRPTAALATLNSYQADIINGRNTLAHAMDEVGADENVTLRSIKRGQPAVVIDDDWMTAFRKSLRKHHSALREVCLALERHLTGQTP